MIGTCRAEKREGCNMPNTPGPSTYIEYMTWDNQPWKAKLQDVTTQITFPLGIRSTIDPNFQHTHLAPPFDSHDDDVIGYVHWSGEHWSCRCHSHTDMASGNVSFTFEHAKEGEGSSREAPFLDFVDINGVRWRAYAPDVGRIPDNGSLPVPFRIEQW
jgi:hypothetical protein